MLSSHFATLSLGPDDSPMSMRRRSSSRRKRKRRSSGFGGPSAARRRISFVGGSGVMRRRNRRTAGFLGIEVKFYDSFVVGALLTAPTNQTGGLHNPVQLGVTNALNSVAQGDGEQERDGRKMMMRSISINGHLRTQNTITLANLTELPDFFIALVLDTQCNGAVLQSAEVYTNPSATSSLSTAPFRNLQFSQRFKVLATRRIRSIPLPVGFDGNNMDRSGMIYPFRIDKKLAIPVLFSGTQAAIANITTNSLSIVAWTSITAIPTQLTYNSRLRFVG